MFVILSGCSGVGKNTVINEMLKRYDDLELLPTYTTREKRENEKEGNPYFFITKKEFEKKITENEFYEYQIVHKNYYGVSRKVLQEKKKLNKTLIKDVDVLGTLNLIKEIESETRILTFFYYVDSREILVERLTERKEKNMVLRLERYDMEMQFAPKYDYIINNVELKETLSMTKAIIDFEGENKHLIPTKPLENIDEKKKKDIEKKMGEGVEFPPIDVTLKNGDIYILDGHYRYFAALSCGKRVAKHLQIDRDVSEEPIGSSYKFTNK